MPYQVSGQAVVTKSHRLPHGTGGVGGAGAAAGGGALVAMSAAVAAPNGAAMSNAEMPIVPSEARFMVFPHLKAVHYLLGQSLHHTRPRGRSKLVATALFSALLRSEHSVQRSIAT